MCASVSATFVEVVVSVVCARWVCAAAVVGEAAQRGPAVHLGAIGDVR
jgi:hypothetical protein